MPTYTIVPPDGSPPAPSAGAPSTPKYTVVPPPSAAPADDKPPPPTHWQDGTYHVFGTDESPLVEQQPIFHSVVTPVLNQITSPVRALAGDALSVGRDFPGSPAWIAARLGYSPEQMQRVKQQIMDATALPETDFGHGVENVMNFPGTMISQGAGAASRAILGDKLTDILAPYAQTAADLAPFGLARRFGAEPAVPLPRKLGDLQTEAVRRRQEARTQKLQGEADKEISDTHERSIYEGGGRNAQDIIDQQERARQAGQQLIAPDLHAALKSLMGSVQRAGGAGAARIRDFLEGRNKGAPGRMDTFLDDALTDQSLRSALKLQADERSARAQTVWPEAMVRGTSTAPFEIRSQHAWQEASDQQTAAQTAVAAAEARLTQARARQATGGNVYAASGANSAVREAQAALDAAKSNLAVATQSTASLKEVMRQAQEDRTGNAPGATWSPGLQALRDQFPEIRAGLAEGTADLTREAAPKIVAGEKFNPRDYAIVGKDPVTGEPQIGAVPTMRAWHAAKMWLDDFLRSDKAFDKDTGRLNNKGRTYAILRKSLVEELDRLNLQYKPARDLYAGDTAVIRALHEGKSIFDEKHFMDDVSVREHFESLGDSEKQAFITGIRQDLENRMDRLRASQDQSTPFSTPWVRKRVAAVLGPAADDFLAKVEREHTMKETFNDTLRGSPTAPRLVDDATRAAQQQAEAVKTFMEHAKRGHLLRGGVSAVFKGIDKIAKEKRERSARDRRDIINDMIARRLIDPNLALNPTGPLLSPTPVPSHRLSPGATYALGTSLIPAAGSPDDY